MKIRKGDKVIVIAGKHKGTTGTVVSTNSAKNTVIVEGVNVSKRHKKESQSTKKSGVYEITRPINVSNVALPHPSKKDKASRVGYKVDSKGKKTRVFKQAANKEVK